MTSRIEDTGKPITIVISDLHLGGGKADTGDDHVYQGGELCRFLAKGIPESDKGRVELFINGDFLEFAQVLPDVYALGSSKYWTSEKESLEKLGAILSGHSEIFLGLKEFIARGNLLTISAGNHDVDLYWEGVQNSITKVVGPVRFALGKDWYPRYDGRLLIGHGHAFDPANKFKHWSNPILKRRNGIPRLEMCPGTLFLVKFFNWLDAKYPFADNVKPIMNLVRILYDEPDSPFKAILWMALKFTARHPRSALGPKEEAFARVNNFGTVVLDKLNYSAEFALKIAELNRKMGRRATTLDEIRTKIRSENELFTFLQDVVVKLPPGLWLPVFDLPNPVSLGIGSSAGTALSVVRSGFMDDSEILRNTAIDILSTSAVEAVICGHTHQPDEWRGREGECLDGGYFNPGSWTRYLDLRRLEGLTLSDLKNEEDFPYQLNYIRVEEATNGNLRGDKICFAANDGRRWKLK